MSLSLNLVVILSAALILGPAPLYAEDITTLKGAVYKNATISRAEPDGIVIVHSAGIVKIPFTELSDEYKKRFNYNEAAAAQFSQADAKNQAALAAKAREDAERAVQKQREQLASAEHARTEREIRKNAAEMVSNAQIFARIKPYSFGNNQTTASIQEYVQVKNGYRNEGLNQVPTFKWTPVGDKFTGVIDERMSDAYEAGDAAVVTLYKIGHTNDSGRKPLFTTIQDKALHYYSEGN